MTKGVDIEITNSTVHGDVVGGDKTVTVNNTTVNVHLHEDQLASLEAIRAAMVNLGTADGVTDQLIHAVLSDPKVEARLDAARALRDQKQVEELVDATIRDHQRAGVSADMVAKLWDAIDKARRANDRLSFSQSGTLLLQLLHNKIDTDPRLTRLADELIELGLKDARFARNLPIARMYQAATLYHQHAAAVTELRSALMAAEHSPIPIRLATLREELKKAVTLSTLSDQYARQALDVSFLSGDTSVAIYVLFAVVTLQSHQHALYHLVLGADGHDLAERVRRSALALQKMIEKSGSPSDVAMLNSNMAAFFLQTAEYEASERLALAAATSFASLGDANSANRALQIASFARKREAPFRGMPTEEDVLSAPLEDIVAGARTGVVTMARLAGIDLNEPKMKAAVDRAFREFSPEDAMRYCENMRVEYAPSPLGMTLGLHALGMKRVSCSKFRRALEGANLDGTVAQFKTGLGCEACEHRVARPADWKWTLAEN